MKNVKRISFVLACTGLVIGAGAGLIISNVLFPVIQGEVVPADDAPLKDSARFAINEPPSISPTDLASVFVLETAPERRLAVYRLLEGQNAHGTADLLRDSLSEDRTEHLHEIQELLFTELAHLDPELSLSLVWETERSKRVEFLTIVMREWACVDPERAMEFVAAMMDPWKTFAFRTILQTRQDLSDEELTKLAERFGASEVLIDLSYQTQLEEVIDDPSVALEFVLQADIPDSRKNEMFALITKRWVDRAGIGDISSMLDLVYDLFSEERYHWRLVVSILATSNPKFAWEQLSNLSLDAQKMLNDVVFEAWVKQDPFEAIRVLNDSGYMTTEDWELTPLYWTWARAMSDRLPENIALIPKDHRSSALRSVISLNADQLPPNEILGLLNRFNSLGVNTKDASDEFISRWSERDPIGALNWVEKNVEKESWERRWNVRTILQQLARINTSKAMEIALQQPAEHGAEFAVIGELLSQNNLEKGLSLLPSVRESSERSRIHSLTAGYLIAAGRMSDAVNLADRLNEEEKLTFFEDLVTDMSYLVDVDDQIAIVRGIDGEELRSSLAASVLRRDEFVAKLTDSEKNSLVLSCSKRRTNNLSVID